jgi:tetrahydromethanopterin S-methyltransferase subunit E
LVVAVLVVQHPQQLELLAVVAVLVAAGVVLAKITQQVHLSAEAAMAQYLFGLGNVGLG